MRQYQPYIQQLDTLTFTLAASGGAPQEVDLKKLEKKLYKEGEIANLIALAFEFDLDPTFTAAPAIIGHNAAVARIFFSDGSDVLFDGSANDLRMFESLENGWSVMGEAVAQTSTNNRFWTRVLHMGPPRFIGAPSDFGVPTAELAQGGKLAITPGVLTDVSADTTAATLVVRVYALLAPAGNELRFAPKYQRLVKPIAGAETNIADEALYAYIAAIDAAYAAFGAGDFGAITVSNTKRGRLVDAVDAEGLHRVFNLQHCPGLIGQITGEPRDATYDVAARVLNTASPTALAAQSSALQPILWCPPGMRMSKLRARNDADDSLTIKFTGAQGAVGSYLLGRFLPHSSDSIARRAQKAATVLGLSKAQPEFKTLDKRTPKMSAQLVKYGVVGSKTI